MEIAPGIVIGERYRLERLIGQGGMGVVWAAEDVVTHQRHAVKLLKEGGDPDAPMRFLREARAASAVRHPNVVRTLHVLELEDGSPVLVMELLDGESLREMLDREHKLPLRELAAILVPVISAVGTAHALGIVHRDLKPENIFLSRRPTGECVVKVLDFGIAKLIALDGEARRSTGNTTGAVLGTPAYMAPEQVFGESDLDHRADIWALGLLLYQCLSGVLPTEGANVGQVLKNVLARPFEPLEQLVPDLPPEAARLVERMLSRERSDRPADLREVFGHLQALASTPAPGFGPPAKARARVDRLASSAVTEPRHRTHPSRSDPLAATLRRTAPRRPTLRRRTVWTTTTALAVLGLAIAGWRSTRSSMPGPRSIVVTSPLSSPDAKLACPLFEASGVAKPAGWLGAAAAATGCERARVILGGRPERTLVPAELLGLPRKPVDDFPDDPYGKADARQRSLDAARSGANAYLDGKVQKTSLGFKVTLELRAADASELASSDGSGRGLYEAVRDAMAPLVRSDLLPSAQQLDPEIAPWERARDVDAALALLDLNLAMAQNAGGLRGECDRFEQMIGRVGELGPAWRWLCARTMGLPEPRVTLDPADPSSAGVATRLRIQHVIDRTDPPDAADLLHGIYERDQTSWGRSLLAATESCVVQSSNPERAYDMAMSAVEAEPKNPDGQPCDPWSQLMTTAQHKGIANNAARAMQAWEPWSSIGWRMQALAAAADDPTALLPLRRAYELSPFDAQIADDLAGQLLAVGKRNDADSVARDQRSGKTRVNQVESDLLSLRVEASEARFRAALELAQKAFVLSNNDGGWVRAQRFEIAWRALELANIVGGAPKLADELFGRFLEPEPSPLDGSALGTPEHVAAICNVRIGRGFAALLCTVPSPARASLGRHHAGDRRPPARRRELREAQLRGCSECLAPAAPRIGAARHRAPRRDGRRLRPRRCPRAGGDGRPGRDAPPWRVPWGNPGPCARGPACAQAGRSQARLCAGQTGHRSVGRGRCLGARCRRNAGIAPGAGEP